MLSADDLFSKCSLAVIQTSAWLYLHSFKELLWSSKCVVTVPLLVHQGQFARYFALRRRCVNNNNNNNINGNWTERVSIHPPHLAISLLAILVPELICVLSSHAAAFATTIKRRQGGLITAYDPPVKAKSCVPRMVYIRHFASPVGSFSGGRTQTTAAAVSH